MSVIWGVSKVEKNPEKENRSLKEQIILGLDPGTNVMGYGVILIRGRKMDILQFGVIQLGVIQPPPDRPLAGHGHTSRHGAGHPL